MLRKLGLVFAFVLALLVFASPIASALGRPINVGTGHENVVTRRNLTRE